MLDYVAHDGCRTRYLLRYFGEDLPADCGHCGWCEGIKPAPMPTAPREPLGEREAEMIGTLRAERADALGTPRQMTRFLCGITSPGLSRARLTRDASFGALAGVPFKEVLEFVRAVGAPASS